MRLTSCDCAAAGWCERHQRWKSLPEFHLCRRDRDWFDAWEAATTAAVQQELQTPTTAEAAPGWAQRFLNFGVAVVRHTADRCRRVEPAVAAARLEICRGCPLCDVPRLVCRHAACGCVLPVKATWSSERCPLGKWPPIDPD